MNFGTLTMVDGVYTPEIPDDSFRRRGLVRMGGALVPRPSQQARASGSTFVVELNYAARAHVLGYGGRTPMSTDASANYSRTYKRLASGGNPLKDAKEFVAQFAGCDEAHKLRKRVIALARTRRTICGEAFRFPLEDA